MAAQIKSQKHKAKCFRGSVGSIQFIILSSLKKVKQKCPLIRYFSCMHVLIINEVQSRARVTPHDFAGSVQCSRIIWLRANRTSDSCTTTGCWFFIHFFSYTSQDRNTITCGRQNGPIRKRLTVIFEGVNGMSLITKYSTNLKPGR